MKVAVVSIADTFFDRVRLLKKYYSSKGYDVVVITSDFSHRNKEKLKFLNDADILIKTYPYKKNLSAARLYSHHQFAISVRKKMEELKPDIIHSIVPANSLCKQLTLYKKQYPNIKLYLDINDLWPEALPIRSFQWFPIFNSWRNLRDRYLVDADIVFVECALFLKGLKNNANYQVLYFARDERPQKMSPQLDPDTLRLVYLGSINNIIDISLIAEILKECAKIKNTELHIIGEGENKGKLIAEARKTGVLVVDHGNIYDVKEKQKIFDLCNYGLNVMKPDVMVGLTMKSLDYMIGGLPILNSIGGDTEELCGEYDLGFNIDRKNIPLLAKKICSEEIDEQISRRNNMQNVFERFFSEQVFFNTLDQAEM